METSTPRRRRGQPHGFLIEQDMDVVLITTGSGEKFGLTFDQAMDLVDDLIDAGSLAAAWAPYDPHYTDRTDVENP